jgi:hypothetical protein
VRPTNHLLINVCLFKQWLLLRLVLRFGDRCVVPSTASRWRLHCLSPQKARFF